MKYSKIIYLIIVLFFVSTKLIATETKKTNSKYPLYTYKFRGKYYFVNTWDVSGHANHGTTFYPDGRKRNKYGDIQDGFVKGMFFENIQLGKDSFMLQRGWFPSSKFNSSIVDSIPCVKKNIGTHSYISVHDQYNDINSQDALGYSFWIKFDTITDCMIYESSDLRILRKDSSICVYANRFWPGGGSGWMLKEYRTEQTGSDPYWESKKWQHIYVDHLGKTADDVKVIRSFIGNSSTTLMFDTLNMVYYGDVSLYSTSSFTNDKAVFIGDSLFGGSVYNLHQFTGRKSQEDIQSELDFAINSASNLGGSEYLFDNAWLNYPFENSVGYYNPEINYSKVFPQTHPPLVNYGDVYSSPRGVNGRSAVELNSTSYLDINNAGGTSLFDTFDERGSNPFNKMYGSYIPFNDTSRWYQNYQEPKGLSISFWIRIGSMYSSQRAIDKYLLPFSSDTPRDTIFCGKNAEGTVRIGMSRINDRLGLFRTFNFKDKGDYPWTLWLYDPVDFRNSIGWHHVVLSQFTDFLRIYMFKPGMTEPVYKSLYFELEEIGDISEISFGSRYLSENLVLDNFKLYNWPLFDHEVKALHYLDTVKITQSIMPESARVTNEQGISKVNEGENLGELQIYPNPAEDMLNLDFTLLKESSCNIVIVDLNGTVQTSEEHRLSAGSHEIQISLSELKKSIYFLQLETEDQVYTKKIIVKH